MPSAMPPQLSEDEVDDLLYLCRAGETQEFTSLVDELCKRERTTLSDILLNTRDEHTGNSPVHMAAANGHVEILTNIIKTLSQPSPQNPTQLSILNAQNAAGNTPLHWAALNGHLEIVKLLIESGADPTITNKAGHDAVYEAELNDKKEVVEWVLREGEGLEEGISGGNEREDDVDEEMEDQGGSGTNAQGDADATTGVKSGIEDLNLGDRTG